MGQAWVEEGAYSATTNRFAAGVSYDAAGNVTVDARFRQRRYEYDANNRQRRSASLDDGGAVRSVYDGAGQRVATLAGGQVTSVMVYDAAGDLVAEYGGAVLTNGTQYVMSDQQGSPRVTMAGAPVGGQLVIARQDYLPFGEEVPSGVGSRAGVTGYGQPTDPRQKYAGMEVDDSTGLSHTLWREFDSLAGRWTAPDPYSGSIALPNPQSFNRYAYVENNPINSVDNTGLMAEPCGADNSYVQCGGGGAFWGGGGFGAETAEYGRYYGGLTSNVVEAVKGYEYRASNGLFGSSDGNSVVTYFDIYYWVFDDGSVETDFRLDGGTVGGYNPLWELAQEVNRRPIGKTFAVLYGGSVVIGATGGAGTYAFGAGGSGLTTLGTLGKVATPAVGGGGAVLNQLSRTDAASSRRLLSMGRLHQIVFGTTSAPSLGPHKAGGRMLR